MFGCYWLRKFTLGGFLIAFLIWSGAVLSQDQGLPNLDSQQGAEAQSNAEALFWTAHEGNPDTYRAICEGPKSRADADLCQQWKMARAAKEQADLTATLLTATIIEVFVLVIVLLLTAATTLVAICANRIAKDSAERQLRAYVYVASGIIHWNNRIPEALVYSQNFGQTPAYGTTHAICIGDGEDNDLDAFIINGHLSKNDLPPEIKITNRAKLKAFDTNLADAAMSGLHPIYVWGIINYTDTFGKLRWTKYRYVMGARVADKPNTFVLEACSEGAKST